MLKLLMALAMTAIPNVASAQSSKTVNFSDAPGPVTISAGGVEATLQPVKKIDGMIDAMIAVRAQGFQSVIVEQDVISNDAYDRWVGITKLSQADPIASVFVSGFTGGAHCCGTLKVIYPYNGRFRSIDFEPIDGDGIKRLPTDFDGDGTVDFVRQDDRFRYQFSSGAGSFSPPIIFNIYKGQLVDVSAETAFRPMWAKLLETTKVLCADKRNSDRNGACAAFVAAGARLGRFSETIAIAEKMAHSGPDIRLPRACSVDLVNYACPKDKETKFYTFGTAIRWFLRENGYLD